MNARQAQALFDGEKAGVKQLYGRYSDGAGGYCAMGLIQSWAQVDCRSLIQGGTWPCPVCGDEKEAEYLLIIHANNDHKMTFSEIARKFGPDSV